MKRQFGIWMEGLEAEFERLLLDTATKATDTFTYLELGVESGRTFRAAYDILSAVPDLNWRMIGVDIRPRRPGFDEIFAEAPLDFRLLDYKTTPTVEPLKPVVLVCSTDEFFTYWTERADFVFIDGCHAEPCVISDFMGVERSSHAGTRVLFHDFAEAQQGGQMQPHCNLPIGVRSAVNWLSLLPPRNRMFWEWEAEVPGEFTSCALVRRIV